MLLVCEDGIAPSAADARTMMLLLHLRDIINEDRASANPRGYANINICSEMNIAEDQKLLQVAEVNDFVVGSEIANRIMAQVSNEPGLHAVYTELLNSSGSEIYLWDAMEYIEPGKEVNFAAISKAIMTVNDHAICLGWKKLRPGDSKGVVLNPAKDQTEIFEVGDQLVVISKGMEEQP